MIRLTYFALLAAMGNLSGDDGAAHWMQANAEPISPLAIGGSAAELAPLDNVVTGARVVAFGEGTHNSHELWSFRNRLFAYLVEHRGFTAIAAETGYGPSIATDRYVMGEDVSPALAARGVFSWSRSTFDENLELVQWMRAYNGRPTTKRKVRFYGLEMAGCMRADGQPIVDAALSYVNRMDSAQGAELQARFAPLLTSFSREGYGSLPETQRRDLSVAAQDLVSLFERWQVVWIDKTSSDDYFRAYRLAVAVRQLAAHFRMGNRGRDIAAAETLRWVLDREGRDGRVFIFTHNGHVAKSREVSKAGAPIRSSLGEFTKSYLGDQYVTIGSLYDSGSARDILGSFHALNATYAVPTSKPGSLNAAVASLKGDQFLINLHRKAMPDAVRDWLSVPRHVRNINSLEGGDDMNAIAAFDALYFVRMLSPQRLAADQDAGPDPFRCEPGTPRV